MSGPLTKFLKIICKWVSFYIYELTNKYLFNLSIYIKKFCKNHFQEGFEEREELPFSINGY